MRLRSMLTSMCRVSCAHLSRLLLCSFEICMIARVPPLTPNALHLLLQTLYTMLTWPCSPTLPHPTDLEHALANNLVRTSMIFRRLFARSRSRVSVRTLTLCAGQLCRVHILLVHFSWKFCVLQHQGERLPSMTTGM